MRSVLLSAFGIHVGGGRVLLDALLPELRPALKAALFDARMRPDLDAGGAPAEFVAPAFPARLRALHALVRRASPGDTVFCFNGLPPLRKPAGARVIVYLQGRHLLAADPQVRYPLPTAVRILLERCWLRLGIRCCDELWVQTPAMMALAQRVFPATSVRVVPFVDVELAGRLSASRPARWPDDAQAAIFLYPADGAAHKNHRLLVQAWQLLARRGCRPLLQLTLGPRDFARVTAALPAAVGEAARIVNLGLLDRRQVLDRLQASSALVFPSLVESFGLPLLEARALGKPILAAERDYVRDVCDPVQTFDPLAPFSIAAAVERFLAGGAPDHVPVLSPREFVRRLAA